MVGSSSTKKDPEELLFKRLGLPIKESVTREDNSPGMVEFRSALFTRIVPAIKDIGLWGPKINKAYTNMGVFAFADIGVEELSVRDEAAAEDFDARRVAREGATAKQILDQIAFRRRPRETAAFQNH